MLQIDFHLANLICLDGLYTIRAHQRRLILLNAVALFGLVLVVGCTQSVPATLEGAKPIPTEFIRTTSERSESMHPNQMDMTESAPHVSPYVDVTIEDVEIRILETVPAQVELLMRGTLPDQCKYRLYATESRRDQNVKVSLVGKHSAETDCSQTIQDIEYVLLLGRDMPEAKQGFLLGEYKLTVNNYQTGFSIK